MGDAGMPWGWIICFCENLADDNNSGASVRISGKLCRKISYVAVNYVVRLRDYAHLPPRRWTTLYHDCARSSASGRSHMRVLPPGTLCPTTSAPWLILSSSENC